jgi:glycosyltransferase involved in cell wall biosynthesis
VVQLRVVFIALTVRGAMRDYIDALVPSLSEHLELHLFIPKHYDGKTGKALLHLFETGLSKQEALFNLINPFLASSIWKRLKILEPDLIHIFNGEGYPWSLMWTYWANQSGIPIIVSVHDPEPHPGNFLESLNSFLRPLTLGRASLVHIHSKLFLNNVIKQGVLPEHIHIIPHGSVAPRFLLHTKHHVPKEPIVLFFGRLETYKGLDVLIEAGLLLEGEFRVIIAGPGHLSKTLLATVLANPQIFELQNRYLDDREVAFLFQRASICVLPYHQATQSSIPLIAAAFNVPVVASSVGAFVEDVPLVNGLLVPAGQPDALAQAIREVQDRTPFYPQNYEFPALAKTFLKLYKGT